MRQRIRQCRAAPTTGVGWARAILFCLRKRLIPAYDLSKWPGKPSTPPPYHPRERGCPARSCSAAEEAGETPALRGGGGGGGDACNAISPRTGGVPTDGRTLQRRN